MDNINQIAEWYTESLPRSGLVLPIIRTRFRSSFAQYNVQFIYQAQGSKIIKESERLMKKGIYICYESSLGTAGVDRKIESQILAFRESGLKIKKIQPGIHKIPGWKLLYRLPFTNINPHWKWDKDFAICDFIYIRHPVTLSFALFRLLKKIRQQNPKVKIIVELHSGIPFTYLKQEKKKIPLAVKDLFCMPFLKKYVDRMAVLGDSDKVYKAYRIKTILFKNGMNFSTMRVRTPKKEMESIDLISVSTMCAGHGYERLIKGLRDYYDQGGKRKIILHFVGYGESLEKYKSLVEKYSLHSNVIFYGLIEMEEIQKVYDNCDIAVSALGLYKMGSNVCTVLKNKEYVGAGLPVIGAGIMDVAQVQSLAPYTLTFPNDSSSINMNRIVKFYDDLYKGKSTEEIEEMINYIRHEGERNLDYKSAMKEVINYIKSN